MTEWSLQRKVKDTENQHSTMYVYTDNAARYTEMVDTFAPLLSAYGYKLERDDAGQTISWAFDKRGEKSRCDEIITAVSRKLLGMLLVCYYTDDNCEDAFSVVEQCRALDGEYEWEAPETFLYYLADGASEEYSHLFTVSQAVADPDECVKTIFGCLRTGKKIHNYLVKSAFLYNISYMRFLQCEDKAWLIAMDDCITDCIVLACMYHSWSTWEEPYTDPESGETVSIERYGIIETPQFKSDEGEAEALFEKVCKEAIRYNIIEEVVWILSNFTPLDTTCLSDKNADDLSAPKS